MSKEKLLNLNKIKRQVSTEIIPVKDQPPIPSVIVRREANERSLSWLFSDIEKMILDISRAADYGGYHLFIMNEGEENKFYAARFMTEEEARRFKGYLEGTNGEWVIVALAADATFVFVDQKGKITGMFVIERDNFISTIAS